jgi:hypothetical protein
MSISLQCPRCGKSASAPDSYSGQSVTCPQCRHHFAAAPAAPAEDAAPNCVGRFQVRAEVGAGAFGTVYRAYDPQLDREVALKVPRPGTLNTPKRVGRFLREGRTAARLCHPHIVPVYDAGQDDGQFYIASAFIEGRPLADALGEGPFEYRRAAEVTHDLAAALAYAHGEGVVHRDVKPANVMLDAAGRPHLMDFGLARRREGEEKLTQDGALLGTPAYMAPEQATGESGDAGTACDQYSLGVLLYELLCGEVPFSGPVDMVLYNAAHTEPQPPRLRRPDVPLDLQTICLKVMAKRPADRYADCRALGDDLRRWLEGEAIRARRPGLAERAVRWCRREPALTAAVAAVLLCLVAVAGTATAMARHDALARENEHKLRREAEDLATSLEEKNAALRRETEERIKAEVAERLAERDKGQTEEAFEKYVTAMLAGQQAFEAGAYDEAAAEFGRAAGILAGTSAARVAERRRQEALKGKGEPQEEDRRRALAQKERERARYDSLRAEADKLVKAGREREALKPLAAAAVLAPDPASAANTGMQWDALRAALDRAVADKATDSFMARQKVKIEMLLKMKELDARAKVYEDLKWPEDVAQAYGDGLKWFKGLPVALMDAEAAAEHQRSVNEITKKLGEQRKKEKAADDLYEPLLQRGLAARKAADACPLLYQAFDVAPGKDKCLAAAARLKAAIDQLPKAPR